MPEKVSRDQTAAHLLPRRTSEKAVIQQPVSASAAPVEEALDVAAARAQWRRRSAMAATQRPVSVSSLAVPLEALRNFADAHGQRSETASIQRPVSASIAQVWHCRPESCGSRSPKPLWPSP